MAGVIVVYVIRTEEKVTEKSLCPVLSLCDTCALTVLQSRKSLAAPWSPEKTISSIDQPIKI